VRTRRLIAAVGTLAAFALPAAASARVARPFDTRPRETPALARAKALANRALPPASRKSAAAAAPRTQLFSGLNFAGLAATQNAAWAGFTPPDPTGAIGPDNYVELVNSQIGMYDTAGGLLQSDDLQTFLIDNYVPPSANPTDAIDAGTDADNPGDSIFDVQTQWDEHSQRWLIATDDVETNGQTHLVFGWSKSTDPTAGWCIYRTNAATSFDDFPKLGHNDTFLLIGSNVFASSSEDSLPLGAHVWAIPKPADGSITTCDDRPALHTFSLSAFTPVPANITDDSATGYVVATPSQASNAIRLYTVTGPAGSPALSGPTTVPVNAWSLPPNVQQPGTTNLIDSADGRLTQAVARQDPDASGDEAIWTQHTVRSADGQRAEVRWYELDATAGTKLQEGDVEDPSNSVFNASISPAADGTSAALQYNVGGRFHLVTMRARTRTTGMSGGAMENEQTLGSSSATDDDFTCTRDSGPCRWGDYSGLSPDPSETDVVWGTNQLNGPTQPDNDPLWVTRNFALAPGGPNPPPDTTADGFPLSSQSPTPTFNFASSETGSSFLCGIDAAPTAPCAPGGTFGPALANGTYTFEVAAVDDTAQRDPTPASATFTIAAPLPDTAIDSGPPASGNSRNVGFAFHGSKPGSTFQCSLDGSAFAACASPFSANKLSPAQHAFAVRSIDAQGNIDPTPATSSFKVVLAAASAKVSSQHASRSARVAVRVTCPASRQLTCAGTVTFQLAKGRHHTKLGSARIRARSGHTTTFHVKLGRKAFKTLKAKKRERVKALFRFSSPTKRLTRTFTLSAPRKR
jgi:hypothetical protein